MADAKDILKDKKVLLGGAVALLVLGGGAAAVMLSGGGGDEGDDTASAPPPPPPGVGAPDPNAPAAGAPGAPGAPAAGAFGSGATTAGKQAAANAAGTGPVRQTTTSFADAPPGYGGAAGGAGAAPGGAPPAGGGAAPGGGANDAAFANLAPIQRGVRQKVRPDPFVSFRIPKYELPPAFSFAVPLRLAAYPKPEIPQNINLSPEDLLGPLPPVERRVAGVLYDGSVSAILETGVPGSASTDVRVIQPGQTVPSGIPGIDELTVSAITPSSVLLRATDGRSVSVNLSNVPAAYAESFRQAVSAGAGTAAGGPAGGPGGPGDGAGVGPGGMRPGFGGAPLN